MSTVRFEQDRLIRAAFAPARTLEPTEGEVARVLARVDLAARAPRHGTRDPRWRHALALSACAIVLLGAGYAAAPPLRNALDSVTGTFSGWLSGHASRAPGRALGPDDNAPAYLRDPRFEIQPRVIAEAGGYALFASRERDGMVNFDLGNTGFGEAMSLSTRYFRQHALEILGPGAMQHQDRHGHVPLFGIAALKVHSVELTYYSGPPDRVDNVRGAFVLLAQPKRRPHAVIALDAHGRVLARQLVDASRHFGPQIQWQQYLHPMSRRP